MHDGFPDGFGDFVVDDAVHQIATADVGSHYDDGVFEIHYPTLGVCYAAVVHDLEEDVEDVGMGFFDFVEEDY